MNSDDIPSLPSEPTMVGHGVPGGTLGQIDQYQLVRKLGGGGFGVVYLARDTVSGIDVALKTLHPLLKTNAEEMERLREKFALVSRLSHPNIASALVLHPVREVEIRDGEARRELRLSPGDSVMVMRYAPGITLSQWRRQFKGGASRPGEPTVPLPLALEIGRQLASALDYAHGEKIVHRDVKPANVMVETLAAEPPQADAGRRPAAPATQDEGRLAAATIDGGEAALGRREAAFVRGSAALGPSSRIRVRILDFGLAAEIRSSMSRVSSETGDTSGTRPYMAPEQWLGKKQDGRTDQYALACVLYELLSGAPPFAGVFETGDPAIMMQAVKGEVPDEIEGVSPAVNAALLKALAKNPKERFATCGDFVAAMHDESGARRLAEPEVTTAPPHQNTTATSDRPQSAPARPEVSPLLDSAAQEAEVLRRKFSLAQTLKAIPKEDRTDIEYSKFISDAETELATADKAIQLDKFAAATLCLDRVEAALDYFNSYRKDYPMHNPWGTLGLVLCVCLAHATLVFLHGIFNCDYGKGVAVIGFTLYAASSFLLWRTFLKKRIMSLYRVRPRWRIGACVLAVVNAYFQLWALGVVAVCSDLSPILGDTPLMVFFFLFGWPIITLVYPIADIIVTRRRLMRKQTA